MIRRTIVFGAATVLLLGCANTYIYEGRLTPDTRIRGWEVEVWLMCTTPESKWDSTAPFEFRLVIREGKGQRGDACIDSTMVLSGVSPQPTLYHVWREAPCGSRHESARQVANGDVRVPLPLPDSIVVRAFIETRDGWGARYDKRVVDYVLPRRKQFTYGGA